MTKINIKDVLLNIDMIPVMEIKNTQSTILIDIDGNLYNNENEVTNKAIIFRRDDLESLSEINDIKELATDFFRLYKPEIIGTTCKIKPVTNWQNIIELNKGNMLYFDHQSDGVELFEDKILEDYGWQASALEINYRSISDFIEENCEGLLVCYDNKIQFNGFTLVKDIEKVREEVKGFIIEKTKENIENSIIELDDEDVIEALEFFSIKV